MAEALAAPGAVRIGSAWLYRADWREIALPAAAPERRLHLIADPPYEPSTHLAGVVRNRGGRAGHAVLGFAPISAAERAELAARAVAEGCRWALLFCQLEGAIAWRQALEQAGAKWKMAMPWVKPNAAPKFNAQGPAIGYELIALAWCRGGHARWQAGGKRGVYTRPIEMRGRVHPAQKPVALMADLIADFTAPGDLVWDPYMGSGTTGVAAIAAGRHFVGCERDPVHFQAAEARLRAAVAAAA